MGRIECRQHGVTGMIFTCPHIIQSLRDQEKTERIIRVDFPDISDIEEKYNGDRKLFYCTRCVVEQGFPSENSEMPRDDFSQMYDKGFDPACWDCFTKLYF
jgi:hypothetical protein